jgi:formylglycine-generating enzyme required for sulfatase activity
MMTGTIRAARNAFAALFAIASLALTAPAHAQCAGDLNGDGRVDGADLAVLMGNWGLLPPAVTSVSPLYGSSLGGTVLTISGSGFGGALAVTVGDAPCTGVQLLSPTQIRAITPPGAVGQAPIAVTAEGGTSVAPQPFDYVPQQIKSIVPSTGLSTGGTNITISGLYLSGATSVTIGGVPCTNVANVSSTQVTAVTPAGSVGAADVVLTGAQGTATAVGGFTYIAPQVPAWATLIEAQPDPAVVTSSTLRAAITATGWAWRVKDTATQIEMMLIPPGTFQMGCSASNAYICYPWENSVHTVTLTNAFYMGRYEVTQAQWQARMGWNPSFFDSASSQVPAEQVPNRPVEQVSWNMVQGFCVLTGMRLPTEAEWEYAYRAGTTTAFYGYKGNPSGTNDDNLVGNIAWYDANSDKQTHPVGEKLANGYGLYDMAGNVWEWASDWFALYSSSPQTNPTGPASGTSLVVRGGSWGDNPSHLRASSRSYFSPDDVSWVIGFRVARAPF